MTMPLTSLLPSTSSLPGVGHKLSRGCRVSSPLLFGLQHYAGSRVCFAAPERSSAAGSGSTASPSRPTQTSDRNGVPSARSSVAQVSTQEHHEIHHEVDPSKWDMNFWHYKPWWCQPYSIIAAGVAFVVGANILFEPSLETTLLAATPVSLWWYIFLYAVPSQFKAFAVHYLETHDVPEPGAHNHHHHHNHHQ